MGRLLEATARRARSFLVPRLSKVRRAAARWCGSGGSRARARHGCRSRPPRSISSRRPTSCIRWRTRRSAKRSPRCVACSSRGPAGGQRRRPRWATRQSFDRIGRSAPVQQGRLEGAASHRRTSRSCRSPPRFDASSAQPAGWTPRARWPSPLRRSTPHCRRCSAPRLQRWGRQHADRQLAPRLGLQARGIAQAFQVCSCTSRARAGRYDRDGAW
jgi:hypothetical protein